MKKRFSIIALLLFICGFVALNTGCEKEPEESCQQDMFCDGEVAVTACCVDGGGCYYTYNGKDYPDTDQGLEDLIDALDCTTAKKSVSIEEQNEYLMARLKWLIEEARIMRDQKNQ